MLLASEASYTYFVKKHFGRGAAALLWALTPLEMGLRSLLWGTLYLTASGRREEARARLRAYRTMLRQGGDPTLASGSTGIGADVEDVL